MQNIFGGGHQGLFGGNSSFNQNAMNPMGQGMDVQEVRVGQGALQFSPSLGQASRVKDRSGRRPTYGAVKNWPWSAV